MNTLTIEFPRPQLADDSVPEPYMCMIRLRHIVRWESARNERCVIFTTDGKETLVDMSYAKVTQSIEKAEGWSRSYTSDIPT